MHNLRRILGLVVSLGVLAAAAPAARAAGLNDWGCLPSPSRPYPVVLVHGRGGDVHGFGALAGALGAAGYCVFATNYGQVAGNSHHGMDHLTVSGAQIAAFVGEVRRRTGAVRVHVIGHSAGTGVLNDFILAKGGDGQVHTFVSFGGLHHPYAHAGASGFLDNDLFLPHLISAARLVAPGITAQAVIVGAINLYAGAGGSLAGIDVETATSNFASDLFDPDYWAALHGGLSESPGTFIKLATAGRGLPTRDSAATVCYTNIVGVADRLAGATAGFQDEAENVENFLLVTSSDHAQILADPVAIAKALAALDTPCTLPPPGSDPPGTPPGTPPPGSGAGSGDGPGSDGDDSADGLAGGCAVAAPHDGRAPWALSLLLLGAVTTIVARTRRGRRARIVLSSKHF